MSEAKILRDGLYEALVSDEMPKNQTLEEHDRQRHGGHFDPSTQSCKFREEMAKETKEDAVDELDSKKGKGKGEREESKTKASLVSPEEDKAYLEAVEKGDMETASKMVRDVAARAFKNTKILDKDGKPLVVYHNGDEKITVPIVPWEGPIEWSGLPGMFFASTELKQYGDVGGKYFINIERPMDMNDGKANYLHGRSRERIDEFADQYEDGIEKGEGEFDFSEDGSLHITDKGLSGLANDGYFGEHPDNDGERVVEYAILTPQQVKSADAVTYDDNGNVIPLSKRFDGGEDVRGDVGNGKKSSDEGSKQSPKEEYDAVVEAFTNPDGSKKEGWMKAPNGNDTNLSERQWVQVRTHSFKKWFGDWEKDPESASKVIDENGEPKVVYHGTDWDPFSEENGKAFFDEERVGQTFDDVDIDYNFFFTASATSAYGYGENVIPCFLNIRNPEIRGVRFEGDVTSERDLHEAIINGHDLGTNVDEWSGSKFSEADGLIMSINRVDEESEKAKEVISEYAERIKKVNEARQKLDDERFRIASSPEYINASAEDRSRLNAQLTENLEESWRLFKEIDKIAEERDNRMPTVKVHTVDLFAVNDANQIKSATDNTGDFSSEDKDIRNSRRVDGQGGVEAWDDESRADAEAAGRVLSNLLGGVSFELSDKPHEERDGGDNRKSISGIYTGSAADYEKPSLVHVGTGEGSQVYGWGLYGSSERGVAESYIPKDKMRVIIDGKDETENDDGEWQSVLVDVLLTEGGSKQEAIKNLNHRIKADKELITKLDETGANTTFYKERLNDTQKAFSYLQENGDRIEVRGGGSLYEQTFFTDREPGDESHLMNWYEKLTPENAGRIQEQASKELDAETSDEVESLTKAGYPNSEVYTALAEILGRGQGYSASNSERLASEFLARAGIDGIKYPVDSYGGKSVKDGNEAGWNYVSFRDDNIRVDHKWVDGEQRFFKNQSGKVVGEYDRRTGKITLYPGAKIKDVVHEFSHGLWQFAEQEAKEGRTDLQEKLHKIAKSAPDAVKESVGRNYANENPNVILEECFTHEMARRSEQNKAFARAIVTARGKKWYQRAWGAIKDTYKGFSRRIGLDKADTSKLDKMGAHEAAEWILGQMAKGKRFGDITNRDNDTVKDESGGSRQSIIGNIASEEVTDAIEKRMIGIRDADARGEARKYFGGRFHSSTDSIRNVRYDSDENAMLINKVVASIMPDLTKRYPKLKDLASGIELLGGVSVEFNDNGKKGKSVGFFLAGEGQDVKGGGLALRVVPEYKKEDYAKGTPSVVACTAENSIIYQRANLMHELGHAMLLRTARERALNPSIGPSWKSVVDGDTSGRLKKVSIYGNSNYNELHSECVSLYTMPGYRKGTLPEEVEKFIKSELV